MPEEGYVIIHEMASAPDSAREYLRSTLAQLGVDMKSASTVIGRNHAYLQQYISRHKPLWLPEQAREALARAYPELDAERLRPPRSAVVHQHLRRDGSKQSDINPPFHGQFVDDPRKLEFLYLYDRIRPDKRRLLLEIMENLAERSIPTTDGADS